MEYNICRYCDCEIEDDSIFFEECSNCLKNMRERKCVKCSMQTNTLIGFKCINCFSYYKTYPNLKTPVRMHASAVPVRVSKYRNNEQYIVYVLAQPYSRRLQLNIFCCIQVTRIFGVYKGTILSIFFYISCVANSKTNYQAKNRYVKMC